VFSFQRATGGIETAVFKKLIAPYKKDQPASNMDGLRKACVDYKYAYFGLNLLNTDYSLSLPCQLVPVPETTYEVPWAFIVYKNSSYKGLINWR